MADADHVHISQEEAHGAVSGGDYLAPITESTALPTRKLIASGITGLVVFALAQLAVDVDATLEQAISVLAMLAAGYLVRNDPTPGGVPDKRLGSQAG